MHASGCVAAIMLQKWKNLKWEILANDAQFAKNFPASTYKCTEDFPSESPKYALPFSSSIAIRQNLNHPFAVFFPAMLFVFIYYAKNCP